jgi:hypothetical protein
MPEREVVCEVRSLGAKKTLKKDAKKVEDGAKKLAKDIEKDVKKGEDKLKKKK